MKGDENPVFGTKLTRTLFVPPGTEGRTDGSGTRGQGERRTADAVRKGRNKLQKRRKKSQVGFSVKESLRQGVGGQT